MHLVMRVMLLFIQTVIEMYGVRVHLKSIKGFLLTVKLLFLSVGFLSLLRSMSLYSIN